MMLSDAIIDGMRGTKKAKSTYFDGLNACCALGAAARMVGVQRNVADALMKPFPILGWVVTNPVSGKKEMLMNIIVELNDEHGWPRNRIARWVAKVEQEFGCAG